MAVTTITFKNPIKFEENKIEKLDLQLDKLTGREISQVKSEWAQAGNFSPVPATDSDFCILVATKASNQPLEFFQSLPANEYLKVSQEVSNFLMG